MAKMGRFWKKITLGKWKVCGGGANFLRGIRESCFGPRLSGLQAIIPPILEVWGEGLDTLRRLCEKDKAAENNESMNKIA